MAQAAITWTPGGNTGTQNIYFKKHSDSTWTLYGTVGPTVSGTVIQNLDVNTLYNFRVEYVCPVGLTGYIELDNKVKFTCPLLTLSTTNTSVTIQWFDLGGDIDSYEFQLFDSTGVYITSLTASAPFSASNTISFTGLLSNRQYTVRAVPSITSVPISNNNCSAVIFRTNATVSCSAPTLPTGGTGVFTRVNDAVNYQIDWVPVVGSNILGQKLYYGYKDTVDATSPPGTGWTLINLAAGIDTYTFHNLDQSLLGPDSSNGFEVRIITVCSFGNSAPLAISKFPDDCYLFDLHIKNIETSSYNDNDNYTADIQINAGLFDDMSLRYYFSVDGGTTWNPVAVVFEDDSISELNLVYNTPGQAFPVAHLLRVVASCSADQVGEVTLGAFNLGSSQATVVLTTLGKGNVTIQDTTSMDTYNISVAGGTSTLGVPYGTYEIIGASMVNCPGNLTVDCNPGIGTHFTLSSLNNQINITLTCV